MSAEAIPFDLIDPEEAGLLLKRSVRTMRRWAARKRTPSGVRLRVFRDGITNIRYFSRRDIIALRGTVFRAEPDE